MEAVTIAPTAGDTSMLAGGFIRLNGVLMIPAMIFAMGTEKNTPLIVGSGPRDDLTSRRVDDGSRSLE